MVWKCIYKFGFIDFNIWLEDASSLRDLQSQADQYENAREKKRKGFFCDFYAVYLFL